MLKRVDIKLEEDVLDWLRIDSAMKGKSRRQHISDIVRAYWVDNFKTKEISNGPHEGYSFGFIDLSPKHPSKYKQVPYDHEYSEEELSKVNNPFRLNDNESI